MLKHLFQLILQPVLSEGRRKSMRIIISLWNLLITHTAARMSWAADKTFFHRERKFSVISVK